MSPQAILPIPSKDYPETIDPRGVLHELETVEKKLLASEKAADYIAPLDSLKKLQDLENEKDFMTAFYAAIAAASISTAGLGTFSIGLLGILLAWRPLVRIQKISRLTKLIQEILEEFEDQGVETLPLIKVQGVQPVDLFIRFPGKEFLLFAIRSFGEATIVYNESKQTLYYKRGPKGTNKWKPDPLMELSEQAYWLKKNRRDLFGSSKGVRKPMPKVLVVWEKTQLQQHEDHLYTTVGGQKFLFLPREGGACYVIHHNEVVDFIRAYLMERQFLVTS